MLDAAFCSHLQRPTFLRVLSSPELVRDRTGSETRNAYPEALEQVHYFSDSVSKDPYDQVIYLLSVQRVSRSIDFMDPHGSVEDKVLGALAHQFLLLQGIF
jgi:hypothetical protein